MFLFDTNMLSEVLKKKPSALLMQRLSAVPADLQYTSCICVMELRYGSSRRKDRDDFWKKIAEEILSRVKVLDVTAETAIIAGDLAAKLSLQGSGISPEDLLIGATALQADLTLITANIRHFEKIEGLRIENWIR